MYLHVFGGEVRKISVFFFVDFFFYLGFTVKGHFVNCFSGFNIQYFDFFC